MTSSNDESYAASDRAGSHDEPAARDGAPVGASPPTLSRWYRTSTREPAARARHLQAIAEAIASARLGEFVDASLAPMTLDAQELDDDAARGARTTIPPRAASASADVPPPAIRLAHPEDRPTNARADALRALSRAPRSPWVRAAALIAFATGGIALLARGHRDPNLLPEAAPTRDVGFALRLPDATVRNVSLAGDFNGWDSSTLPMVRDPADGTWRVHIPLAPGRHTYSYVVDGTRWVIDPLAPRTVEGALGPANVIAVMGDT